MSKLHTETPSVVPIQRPLSNVAVTTGTAATGGGTVVATPARLTKSVYYAPTRLLR